MGTISYEDKMRIQTLHEQGLGAKAIRSRYPVKQWSLNTLKTICHRTTKTGSAVTHQSGSGRPKSARTAQNIAAVSCGKGRLNFVEEKAKVNADYYTTKLLPNLVEDGRRILPGQFIFEQDGAPAITTALAQNWIGGNCPDFIRKNEWPPY